MAVLARLKIAPNQRLDLPDILAFDAYAAGDWKYFLNTLTGGRAVVVKGFEIFEPNSLIGNPAGSVDVVVADSSLWWPNGSEGSFYASLATESNRSITLITNTTNYIEMTLSLSSKAEDARALWDPGANGGAGGEFTQVIDTEHYLDIEISRNNTGFSSDKIPLAKIVVNSFTNVESITDCRPLLFRLGSGGTSPDPVNSFSWEDDPLGFSRTDTAVTMTSPTEENVFRGADKNITNLKDWMDAVMTRVKELAGQPKWFAPAPGSPDMPLSLSQLFLDSQAGHSIQPDRGVSFTWSKDSDGKFRSENAVGVNRQVSWKSTFGQLSWNLGGSFVSSLVDRNYLDFTFEKFVSPEENLYISLQRDSIINGNPVVTFQNISGSTACALAASTGAFTGVAVGDYLRKASSSLDQYYKVQELRVNTGTPFTGGTSEGTVANATVQYVVLTTHDGPISKTTEKFKYFRSRYSQDDLLTDSVGELNPNHYWIGRRNGDMFYLRDYGDMQPGEEVESLNDSETQENGGSSDLILERANDSVYDPLSGYALKSGGLTDLLTVRRRLLDNTIGAPSGVDNSDASLTYTISAPVGTIPDTFGLWIRLGNSSGTLSAGSVTNVATDNVWEIRDPIDNPLRTYDNRNVYLVARKFTISSVECLIFADGTMMSYDGQWVNNHLSVQSDLFLKSKTQWSVPFIGTVGGRVDENNSQFFWNNVSGNDSLGVLGVRNLRITEDTANNRDIIDQDVAQDHHFLPNLGSKTIRFGNSNSTVYIPGDLIVDGNSASINTMILQSDDKIISMGVGNLNDGGNGSGFEVADNTKNAVQLNSVSGQAYIDIAYSSSHSYIVGDELNVDSNVACGGITAGQLNGSYTVVASASTAGQAQVISLTVLRIYTNSTAIASSTVSLSPPITQVRTYKAPWSVRLGSSDGSYAGVTSWVFRVKNQATTPTLTPVSSYGIVPTAHFSNMQAMRIPFVNDDNAGPSGADTTINFTGNLTWNNSITTLIVDGAVRITQTGTSDALVVEDSANVDSTPFVVDANGNVIVGYTSLITASSSATTKLASVNGLLGLAQYSADSTGQALEFLKSRNSSLNAHTAVQSNDQLGIALFSGSDGTSFVRSASIEAAVDASVNANEVPGRLVFSTASAAAPGSPVTYSSDLGNYGNTGIGSGTIGLGSRFIAASSGTVQSLTFYPSQNGASGTVQAELWSTTGGVANTLLATSTPVNANSLPSLFTGVPVVFTFASPPSIASGVTYMAVIRFVTVSGTIYLKTTNLLGTLWSAADIYSANGSAAPTTLGESGVVITASMSVGASSSSVLTERMRIDSTGDVGIGTTNPTARLNVVNSTAQDAVRITQTGTGNALVVEDATNPDASPFVIDENGCVLLGSLTRTAVNIAGLNFAFCKQQIIGSSPNDTTALIANYSTSVAGPNLAFAKSAGGSQASPVSIVGSVPMGRVTFLGYDGAAFFEGAKIEGQSDAAFSLNSAPGRLTFSTTPNGSTVPVERMRIDSNGNVGIGTANPTSLFSVGGSNQFQVNSSGNIVKLNDITYSWPSSQGAASTSLMNDGSGNLSWNNAAYWAYKSSTVTTNYSVLASDMVVPISTTANSSNITMTLPTASSVGIGKVYIFKDVGGQCSQSGKQIIIARSGSDMIDGDTTLTMENDYVSFTLVSSGSAWSAV